MLWQRLLLATCREPAYLAALARSHGDWVSVRVLGREFVLLSDPLLIEQVLNERREHFQKGQSHRRARQIIGSTLQVSAGQEHRQQRRVLARCFAAFSEQSVRTSVQPVVEQWLAAWPTGEVRDLAAEMNRLATYLLAHLLCAEPPPDLDLDQLDSDLGQMGGAFRGQHPHQALKRIEAAINKLLTTPHRPTSLSIDFVGVLRGGDASLDEQRIALRSLLLGGRETIAAALTWSNYLLSQHPHAAAKVRSEAQQFATGAALPYTRLVLQESMRLYPPSPTLVRRVSAPYQLGNHRISAESVLLMSPYVVQRDPRYYQQPEQFWPERWLQAAQPLPRYAYFPFGGGPRRCIGERLAWHESVWTLAILWQQAQFQHRPGPLELAAGVSLQPKTSLLVWRE